MTLLAFSTSSEMLSVALLSDSQLIKQENHFLGLRHSEKLVPTIKDILDASSFSLKDIDGFAIDIGPGSFTGLRIGLATLKGLVFGEKKKVIGVSSLDALAENIRVGLVAQKHAVNFPSEKIAARCSPSLFASASLQQNLARSGSATVFLATQPNPSSYMCDQLVPLENHLICPIIDAKQDRVYTAIYGITKSGLRKKLNYCVIKVGDLLKKLNKKKVIFLGDGLGKYQDFIVQTKKEAIFLPRKFWFPYASVIAKLGGQRLKGNKGDNIDLLLPMYLTPFKKVASSKPR